MFSHKSKVQPDSLTDQAAQSADHVIKSTQRVANDALDSLTGTVQDIRHHAEPVLNHATDQASAMMQHGIDSIRDTSQHLRDKAMRATDSTVNYIKEEPVKAMLIAAATGAALMALIRLMSRSSD